MEKNRINTVRVETGEKVVTYRTKNLWNHTLEVMTRVPATIEHRLAALLHDVGKVNTMTINNTGIHFYQHQFRKKSWVCHRQR